MVEKYTQPFPKTLIIHFNRMLLFVIHLFVIHLLLISTQAFAQAPQSFEPSSKTTKPLLEKKRQAIRNGSTIPENLLLTNQQINAIGWLYFDIPSNPFCTATVISPQAVITAKHCFLDENGERNAKIRGANIFGLGLGLSPDAPVQNNLAFDLESILFHPSLDIAIIEFPFSTFTQLGITPIVLNDQPLENGLYDAYIGQMMDIGGFGQTYTNAQFGKFFASVRFELMSSESIFVNGLNRMGICGGDSGALLLAPGADGQVKGIALEFKGDPCCMGVDQLTRIDIAFDWLLSNVAGVYQSEFLLDQGCWGISQQGLCRDGRLITCKGQYQEINCMDRGLICSRSGNEMDCVEPVPECVNLDADGLCDPDGKKIYRCVQQTVVELLCDPYQYCEMSEGRAICMNILGSITETGEDVEDIPECTSEENLSYAESLQGKMIAQPNCNLNSHQINQKLPDLWVYIILLGLIKSIRLRLRSKSID